MQIRVFAHLQDGARFEGDFETPEQVVYLAQAINIYNRERYGESDKTTATAEPSP